MQMRKLEKWVVNSDLCNFLHKTIIFPRFFNFINKEIKGKALEIGCGIGMTSKLITQRYKSIKLFAVDYDKEQIQKAKKNKKLRSIKFINGDATNLNFRNSSFDYVIETNTFHHIENYSTAIKEVYRVLKPDGTFYLMDLSKYLFIWPIRLVFPPESYFTKKEFISQLEKNGFKIEKSNGKLLFFIIARKIS